MLFVGGVRYLIVKIVGDGSEHIVSADQAIEFAVRLHLGVNPPPPASELTFLF